MTTANDTLTDPPGWCREELGHIRAEHETRFLDTYARSVTCRAQAEIEAESIAYLVAAATGLEADAYSVPYVTGWSGGDAALLQECAARVVSTARGIVAALDLDQPEPSGGLSPDVLAERAPLIEPAEQSEAPPPPELDP